ncbi:hypothetical protein EVAR_31165_1 [Eumeta japonica]|uniref:Uncharacterized protein n=1 Tax=Eumeta variegata TaxID=151549 RepID=A0A4C1VY65_EUMVA|nr:hypothetical protein EVAR_31165_1 [Eumeta japonica]
MKLNDPLQRRLRFYSQTITFIPYWRNRILLSRVFKGRRTPACYRAGARVRSADNFPYKAKLEAYGGSIDAGHKSADAARRITDWPSYSTTGPRHGRLCSRASKLLSASHLTAARARARAKPWLINDKAQKLCRKYNVVSRRLYFIRSRQCRTQVLFMWAGAGGNCRAANAPALSYGNGYCAGGKK